MTDNLLNNAINVLKAGDRAEARRLLMALLREEPRNDRAWLVLSAAMEDPERQRQCLETALEINPENETARQRLARLESPPAPSVPSLPPIYPTLEAEEGPGFGHDPASGIGALPSIIRRRWPVVGAVGALLILCFCYGLTVMFSDSSFGNGLLGTDEDFAEERPTRDIPPTYTPEAPTAGSGSERGSCPRAGRYADDISGPVYAFAETVKLGYEVETDAEMMVIVLALDERYEEFQAVPVPDCALGPASNIDQGMEAVILALEDFTVGEIDSDEATERTHEGVQKVVEGLDALIALSE